MASARLLQTAGSNRDFGGKQMREFQAVSRSATADRPAGIARTDLNRTLSS